MVDLTQVVVAVLTLIISMVSAFLVSYLKTKIDAEKLENIRFWVNIAVEAAEQIYAGSGRGKEKKKDVLKFLQSKGFTLNAEEIEKIIQAAVLNLKSNKKEEAHN
ncbi:phage holin, LLH family [Criibacterium bergeronii]|nr:phage holin, LLH family [Criibacterium bergeronii]